MHTCVCDARATRIYLLVDRPHERRPGHVILFIDIPGLQKQTDTDKDEGIDADTDLSLETSNENG